MGKRKRWVSLAVMLGILALTMWIIFRDQDPAAVGAALSAARPGWLVLGVLLAGGFIAFEALGSWLTLRAAGHRASFRHCMEFSTVGFYFSSVTPSSTGGQPAQVFYMARRGIPAAVGALDMLMLTVAYQVMGVVYALTAWAFYPQAAADLGTGLGVLLGYGATVNTLLTLLVLLLLFRPAPARQLCQFFLRLGSRLRLVRDMDKAQGELERQMEEYRRGAALLRARPGLFVALACTTAAQFTCRYLIPWTVYRAMGLSELSAARMVAIQALVSLAVGTLPIPGSVGASEAAFLTAYRTAFGPGLAPAAMLLSQGASFYLPLLLTGLGTAAIHIATRPGDGPPGGKSG